MALLPALRVLCIINVQILICLQGFKMRKQRLIISLIPRFEKLIAHFAVRKVQRKQNRFVRFKKVCKKFKNVYLTLILI